MKLIIEDDEGRKTVVPLIRDEMTIGRQDGNTIRLTERNVSRRHARLLKENGSVLIEDLGSYNGVRVNGEKISGPTKIKEGDLVEIGDYDLGIQGKFDGPVTTPSMGSSRPGTIPPGSMKAAPRSHPPTSPGLAAAPAVEPVEKTLPPDTAPPASATTPNATAGGATAIIRVSDITAGASSGEARDLERSQMPRLVGLAGPFRGKEFYLMRSEVKFGRTDENDIVADHQSVSRAHARFVLEDGQWKVIDNKSANGVRVNGDEYAVSNLKPGDVLELGHLKFRFCAPGEKFSPPPEKTEDGAEKGGLKPTTAELIAATQGRQVSAPAAKAGAPVGKIVLIVLVLAAVGGAAAFFATRERKPSNPDEVAGEDAVKAADVLFKQRKYIAASELYDKAGNTAAPNRKKAAEEAKGEEAFASMKAAIDAGDGDKARNLLERCGAESTYWCGKAQEQGDAVKAVYAKKHLDAARGSKSAGKLENCLLEANNVLGFDPSNAEAQSLQTQCRPHEVARAEPARQEGPTPKEREAKASRLARSSHEKLVARDFAGAVKDANAALQQSPADKNTLMVSYQSLGYGYAYLNDKPNAVKWLEKYLPYCSNDCDQVHAFIGK
jgi:pSer/pThr/pTyr-binding forkhead associated (FHA) protein